MTLEKHNINRGLQRIVESYQKEARSDETKVKTNLLKEEWYHFEYASGANPYIAFSKKERDRILRKYKGKVEDLGDNHYLINDDDYTPNYFDLGADDESFNEALKESYAYVIYYDNNGKEQERAVNGANVKAVENKVKRLADKYEIKEISQASEDVVSSKYLNSFGDGIGRTDYFNGKFDEALSDEAKANNEMIQKILNKKPSQLTAKEKQFLADNDLVRQGGPGNVPSIGKSGARYYTSISKGDRTIYNQGLPKSNKSTFANIDNVDQLNYLKKREDRWKARSEASKDPDILEPVGPFGAELQNFNMNYVNDIKKSKESAQEARDYIDSYIEGGYHSSADFAKRSADESRWFRDRAKKRLENRPKFSESLEEDDYFDFVHDLSTAVKERTKKWQSRGISASDVANALDELSVRFEEASEYDEPDDLE